MFPHSDRDRPAAKCETSGSVPLRWRARPERHIRSLDRGVVIDILKRIRHEARGVHRC